MTKAESAASRTPSPGVLYFSPDQKDYWTPKRIRILHDYIAALELEAADLRSCIKDLRERLAKGQKLLMEIRRNDTVYGKLPKELAEQIDTLTQKGVEHE